MIEELESLTNDSSVLGPIEVTATVSVLMTLINEPEDNILVR